MPSRCWATTPGRPYKPVLGVLRLAGDLVGHAFGHIFGGDFFDAQLTRGDDDADAAFVVGVDDFHGVTSAEDGDIHKVCVKKSARCACIG